MINEALALIRKKQDMGLAQLVQCDLEGLKRLQREAYLQALDQGIITALNLITARLGTPDGDRIILTHTNPGASVTRLSAHLGTLSVSVNGLTVLTNQSPGQELLIPGSWLIELLRMWEQFEAQEASRVQIANERAKVERLQAWTSIS